MVFFRRPQHEVCYTENITLLFKVQFLTITLKIQRIPTSLTLTSAQTAATPAKRRKPAAEQLCSGVRYMTEQPKALISSGF